MGKNKLKKFDEMERLERVFQYPFGILRQNGFPFRGKWRSQIFGNNNPIVLELGCGKGEYTVGLAERFHDKNFIGIDIKGARMWSGAKYANENNIHNAAFLRTSIELIADFFEPEEVDEIWITFPDPQMKKTRKRLTSTTFMSLYRKVLRPDGIIHLKTDSPFLYTYTNMMVNENSLPLLVNTSDLYASQQGASDILGIKTHYERQWLERGLTIKYLSFTLPANGELVEPICEIEPDTYRSYSRGEVQCPNLKN